MRDESEEDALRPFSAFGGEGPFGFPASWKAALFFPRFVFRRAGLADKPALSPLPCSYSESEEKNACQTLCFEFTDEPSKLNAFCLLHGIRRFRRDRPFVPPRQRRKKGNFGKSARFSSAGRIRRRVWLRFLFGRIFREKNPNARTRRRNARQGDVRGVRRAFCDSFALLERPSRVYAAGLLYSGNARLAASADVYPRTRLRIGVNGAARETLASGEGLSSPEALMTFAEDEDSVRATVGAFFARHLLRGKWKDRERPALFFGENAAEGETLTKKIELAEGEALSEKMKFAAPGSSHEKIELAARSGAEIFVLDADVFAEPGRKRKRKLPLSCAKRA